ncbi:MAG: DUF2341 domain-containing protein [Balneola sp.]|nr:MAG: DUF2341 domain-containing protein [Balneola sp.]
MTGVDKIRLPRVGRIVLFLFALSFTDIALGQVSGYSNRLKFQVNASQVADTSDISNFPVLVNVTNNDLRTTGNGGFVENTNGYDIIFTAANGSTILSHQLEEYNAATGEITFWVRFPTLAALVDTEFYIYFGNNSIASDQSSTNVWDSNYKLVMHLNEAAAGGINFTDASGNISSSDISDNATEPTDGQISGGRLFNDPGTGDLITISDNGVSPLDISGNITISVWINISNVDDGPDIISKGSYLDGYAIWVNGSGLLRFQINNSALSATTNAISNGSWNYIVATRASNGDRVIYLNGAEIASDNNAASFEVNDDDLFLSTASFDYEGIMDEFRLSNITRDSAWVATEYNNKNSPGTFITEINAEPIASDIEGTNLTYNSGDSPTIITSAITLTDGNDTNLQSASIQITGNFVDTQDELGFVDQNGISGSYSSVTGILTLTGTSSVANYQTALQSITYENTNPDPTTATRTVSFTVNDGIDDSNTETRDITVVKVNIDPVLANIESSNLVYFASSGERTITSTIEVSDSDNANLDSAVVEFTFGYISSEDTLRFIDQNGITGSWNESTGKLTLSGSATLAVYETALRSITYENESGSPTMSNRTISFRVNDGTDDSNTLSRDIEYPTSIADFTNYKTDVVFHFDAQDADGNGDSGTGQPADGTLASWTDITGNITTTAPGGDEPTLDASYFGERGGIFFDYNSGNAGDHYPLSEPSTAPTINSGTFTEKSFALVFRTTNNIAGLHTIYEQGGSSRGYNLTVKDSAAYAYAYSNAWGDQNKSINLGTVEPNTSYIMIASHGSTGSDATSYWRASLNGGTIQELDGATDMANHGGDPNIGEEDGTRDPTSFSNPGGTTSNFDGFVGEFISWNDSLVTSDFTNIYAYLSEKWFNVAPVLADIEVSNLSYNEGEGTVNITSALTITDTDNTTLDSAKVSITSGFESSEDVLDYVTALGISGTYDSGSGVLTLTGTTTVSDYQTALRNVTYENTETTTPSTTTRQISFIVYDWDDSSAEVTREIDIAPNNDLPTLANLEAGVLAFTENDGPTSITDLITVSDTDDTNLEGATVAFTNNYFLGEDELAYSNALGITGSFDAMSGVLTLTGSATLANYQTALRNVTYENVSSDPVTGLNRTIEVRVFDGIDSSATGTTRDISVASSNTAPTLASIESSSIFYQVGDSSIISETITLTDPDDTDIDSVTFQITANYNSAEDTLTFQPLFGITPSWTDDTGALTLRGPASKADFQSAIRTVLYQNTTTTPSDIQRTVSITANDGELDSNIPTRNISFSIPKSVNNLLLWLKGDEGTFTTTAGSTQSSEGTDVGRWEDQSDNGRDFTATNSGNEPTFRESISALNDQNAIEFPGSTGFRLEDTDAGNYLNGLNELTIFFVIQSYLVNTDRGFWTTYEPNAFATDSVFSIRYDSEGDNGLADDVITTGMRDLDVAFVQESFEDAQTTTGQIVMLKWTSEENYELYIDGVLSNPSFFQNVPTGALANVTTAIIGQGTQDLADSWNGLIAEVILYGEDISIEDQESVEDYLSIKYGIDIRSLTAATGGDAISADDASIAPSPAYTTLTGPRVQESFEGEFTNGGTFVFTAPTGFEWNASGSPSASVLPAFGGSTELAISAPIVTSTEITFTISAESASNPGEITFSNFEVRPTTGTLPNTGNITNTGTTGLGGSTSYGTLTMVAGTQIEMEFAEQPSASNVSSAISPAVRVQLIDQFGNSVEESRVNIDIARNIVSGSGDLGGTTTEQTNVFGIAEFDDINIDAVGTYTLTASSTGLTDTTSNQFDVVVLGQLTQFIVERVPSGNISDKLAGQNFNITVVAVDGIQDTVDTFTGTVSLSSDCTMGTGQGTTDSFVGGVLSSATVSISSLGTCSITATNTSGSESGTSNTFDVTPGAPSEATTTISASPTVILNDGFSTSTITIQTKDSEGNDITSGGETILLSATDGVLTSVTDNSDGTYTATLTSSVVAGIATISGTLNAVAITDDAEVEFAEFNNLWQSSVGSVADARNWDLATNWSSGSVPVSGDKVLVPAVPAVGNEQPVVSTTNTTIAQLSVEASASVTVSGGIELIINGELSGDGEVLGSNTDSVTIAGNLAISDMSVGFVKLNGTINQDVTTPNDYVNLELDNINGADFTTDLSVSDTLKLTNGTLFLPSGTTLIANEKQYGNGELRMQQRMFGDIGWRLISSPIDTTFGEFLDGVLTQGYDGAFYDINSSPGDTLQPNVLYYLESYDNSGNGATDNQRFRAPTSSSQKVTQGQGMFVFLFGDIAADSRYNDPLPDTLDVSGQEFDGDGTEVDFGVTYTTTADSGWNLVGNPFLATIDWDDEANWTKTNIESTIYIWDPSANGGDGEYLTWNGTTGTLPNGGLIPPFQGFWVKANSASPELKVNKSAKTIGGSFLKKELPKGAAIDTLSKGNNIPVPILDLAVTSASGRQKRTNLMFSDQGLRSKDILDAYTLSPLTSSFIEFHTLLGDGSQLAINSLPIDFNSRLFIPMHIAAFEDGVPTSEELTILWDQLRGVPEDWILTLIDNETGEEINMAEEQSYTFFHSTRAKVAPKANPSSPNFSIRAKSSTQSTRFTLKVSTELIERDVPEEVFLSQNYPNPFNPSTTIPFGLNEDSNVELVVYDILGRKIKTLVDGPRIAGRYEIQFNSRELASGVYFYRLITSNKVLVKKFTLIK